jgi:[acyl-carrier-protein] S-malonyltransferase
MRKTAFFFPGVGSQYIGMSKTLYDRFKVFRETIEEAGDILKLNLTNLSFLPENKAQLDKLENAQCALITFSTATYRVFAKETGIKPHFCMGHSLGEYSALCCAGAIRFKDALTLVKQRGLIVNDATTKIDGTMMWVVNMDVETVEQVCDETSEPGAEVYISAYDSPVQCSISGHNDTIMKAAKKLEKKGALVFPLKFSGPFHSPLMKETAQRMESVLRQFKYKSPKYPVIANQNARPYGCRDQENITKNLSQQLVSPIRWSASIDYLLTQGVGLAIEIGPKNVLKFLTAKNTDEILTYTTDNEKDLEMIRKQLVLKEEEHLPLMGKCLGAAVSTKNRNNDDTEYNKRIVKPYREIETLYKQYKSNGHFPSINHVKQALEMTFKVLSAKDTPQSEQMYWFRRLSQGKVLPSF